MSVLSDTGQKMKFSITDFFSKCVTLTEEILNGKLHFLCSVIEKVCVLKS